MSSNELREKGMAMRETLFGEAFTAELNDGTYTDPVMQEFRDVIAQTVFGALWTRPGLDLKTRTLICVVSDVATGRPEELALHLRMARRQGWSEQELVETLVHLSGYVGAPLVREAFVTASRVFAQLRGEDEGASAR